MMKAPHQILPYSQLQNLDISQSLEHQSPCTMGRKDTWCKRKRKKEFLKASLLHCRCHLDGWILTEPQRITWKQELDKTLDFVAKWL